MHGTNSKDYETVLNFHLNLQGSFLLVSFCLTLRQPQVLTFKITIWPFISPWFHLGPCWILSHKTLPLQDLKLLNFTNHGFHISISICLSMPFGLPQSSTTWSHLSPPLSIPSHHHSSLTSKENSYTCMSTSSSVLRIFNTLQSLSLPSIFSVKDLKFS